jgi:hypothetical protein
MKKQCNVCKVEKDLSEFDSRSYSNYVYPYCKVCRRNKQNAFHKLNPQTSTYNKEYRKKYLLTKPKDWEYNKTKNNRIKLSKKYNVTISAIAHHSLKVAVQVFDKYDRK